MTAVVTIDRAGHSHPVPKGLGRFVEEALESRGVSGEYRLRFGPRITGTAHTPRFRARGVITQAGVELVVKPGGNDTAHTCWLAPCTADSLRCEDLSLMLRENSPAANPLSSLEQTPSPPRPMVDLAEIEAELRAEEERLALSAMETEEGIRDRETQIAVLQSEMEDLRARHDREAEELAAVRERLAHVQAVVQIVFQPAA